MYFLSAKSIEAGYTISLSELLVSRRRHVHVC